MTTVRNYIPQQLRKYTKPGKDTMSDTLDINIYTSALQFLLIYNTKLDKNRYLEVDPMTTINARCPRDSDDIITLNTNLILDPKIVDYRNETDKLIKLGP